MASTNDANDDVAGIYAAQCCDDLVACPEGWIFPLCPRCGQATTYQLVYAVKSPSIRCGVEAAPL